MNIKWRGNKSFIYFRQHHRSAVFVVGKWEMENISLTSCSIKHAIDFEF